MLNRWFASDNRERLSRQLKPYKRIFVVVLAVIALAGCQMSGTIRWETSWHHVQGKVTLVHGDGPPIVGATIRFVGDQQQTATTSHNGTFSLRNVKKGTYRVIIETLHGTYERTGIRVQGDQVFHFTVTPLSSWYHQTTFLQLSGISRYDDRDGRWKPKELTRWNQSRVGVMFAVDPRVPTRQVDSRWISSYFSHAQQWEGMLGHRISIEQAYSSPSAQIRVLLVPENSIERGSQAAVFDPTGSRGEIHDVQIYIDVRYSRDPSLWRHLWARAMGVHRIANTRSLMAYNFQPGNDIQLTEEEKRHIQLMYDLPAGTRSTGAGWQPMALSFDPELHRSMTDDLTSSTDDAETMIEVIAFGEPVDLSRISLLQADNATVPFLTWDEDGLDSWDFDGAFAISPAGEVTPLTESEVETIVAPFTIAE